MVSNAESAQQLVRVGQNRKLTDNQPRVQFCVHAAQIFKTAKAREEERRKAEILRANKQIFRQQSGGGGVGRWWGGSSPAVCQVREADL